MESYIYIDGWKTNIRFSSAHIIPEYEKCGRLHGHTYAVHAKVTGTPDEKGIILDFSVLKEELKRIVNKLDHKILIPADSKVIQIDEENESIKINSLGKLYVFPKSDCILLPIESTSAENISKYILDSVVKNVKMPESVKNIEIGVDEGFGQGARVVK